MLHHTLAEDESLDDVDLQFPAGDDVAAALARLGECETVDCLVASHQELAGRTRFNLPHFFLIGAPLSCLWALKPEFPHAGCLIPTHP
jgi:hypothetical protein